MIPAVMNQPRAKDPLHGITLEKIVTALVEHYGWEQLGEIIDIRCFNVDPSVQSSLKFLRKTPWARKKVEDLYVWVVSTRTSDAPQEQAEPAPDPQPE
jgi:uncharacterized protein (DUF2132 family)